MSTLPIVKQKIPPKPTPAGKKNQKDKGPKRLQPAWLFPPDEENPVLNPKEKSQEEVDAAIQAREKAVDYMQRRVHGAPDRPAPNPLLLTLIGVFLTDFGFNSTSRLFTNERSARKTLNGWEDALGKKLGKNTPKLEQIFRDWHRDWVTKQGDDTSSSGSSSESDGGEEVQPVLTNGSGPLQADNSKSDTEDVEMVDSLVPQGKAEKPKMEKKEKKAKKEKKPAKVLISSGSESVGDDEKGTLANGISHADNSKSEIKDLVMLDSLPRKPEAEKSKKNKKDKKAKKAKKATLVSISSGSESDADDEKATLANGDAASEKKSSKEKSSEKKAPKEKKSKKTKATLTETVPVNELKRKAASTTPDPSSAALENEKPKTKKVKTKDTTSATSKSTKSPKPEKEKKTKSKKKSKTPPPAAINPSSSSSSSSDSDEAANAPKVEKSKAAPPVAAPAIEPVSTKPSVTTNGTSTNLSSKPLKAANPPSSSDTSSDSSPNSDSAAPNPPKKTSLKTGTAQPTPLALESQTTDPSTQISNKYQSYTYADKAFRDLSITKGKGFTKEKNKKKRGSYRGGTIDTSGGKGFKFED